jgi:hypothetical protein
MCNSLEFWPRVGSNEPNVPQREPNYVFGRNAAAVSDDVMGRSGRAADVTRSLCGDFHGGVRSVCSQSLLFWQNPRPRSSTAPCVVQRGAVDWPAPWGCRLAHRHALTQNTLWTGDEFSRHVCTAKSS